jgi:hypothetical protein
MLLIYIYIPKVQEKNLQNPMFFEEGRARILDE